MRTVAAKGSKQLGVQMGSSNRLDQQAWQGQHIYNCAPGKDLVKGSNRGGW